MKFISVFLFLVYHLNSNAQDFSVSEIVSYCELNIDEIDTKIVKKGYEASFTKHASDTNCIVFYEYVNSTLRSNDISVYNCIYDGFKTNISYRTRENKAYTNLKEQILNLGFIYKETISTDRGKMIFYVLNKNNKIYELSLSSSSYDGFNLYEVTINID